MDMEKMEKMEKNGSPKISVIVPVYNTARYLARCLDSIAAQTFPDWECLKNLKRNGGVSERELIFWKGHGKFMREF